MENPTENDRKPDQRAGCAVADLFGGWVDSRKTPHPPKPGKKAYEQIPCLVVYNGEIEICQWNCEHLVWDDASGDDFRYNASTVTHWAFLPDLPNAGGVPRPESAPTPKPQTPESL